MTRENIEKFFEHPSTKMLAGLSALMLSMTAAFGVFAHDYIKKDVTQESELKILRLESDIKSIINQNTSSFALLLQEYRLTNEQQKRHAEEIKQRLLKIEAKLR